MSLTTQQIKVGDTVNLKSGFGYWDITKYPIGGDFRRVGNEPLQIKITRLYPEPIKGCNAQGETPTGRWVSFVLNHTI